MEVVESEGSFEINKIETRECRVHYACSSEDVLYETSERFKQWQDIANSIRYVSVNQFWLLILEKLLWIVCSTDTRSMLPSIWLFQLHIVKRQWTSSFRWLENKGSWSCWVIYISFSVFICFHFFIFPYFEPVGLVSTIYFALGVSINLFIFIKNV